MFVVPLELCVKCYAFVFKSELFAQVTSLTT